MLLARRNEGLESILRAVVDEQLANKARQKRQR